MGCKLRLDYFYTSPFYLHFGQNSLNEQRRRGQKVEALREMDLGGSGVTIFSQKTNNLKRAQICFPTQLLCFPFSQSVISKQILKAKPGSHEFVVLAANEDAKEGGIKPPFVAHCFQKHSYNHRNRQGDPTKSYSIGGDVLILDLISAWSSIFCRTSAGNQGDVLAVGAGNADCLFGFERVHTNVEVWNKPA